MGDSITDQAREEIASTLDERGWRVRVDAEGGAMHRDMQHQAEHVAGEDPDVVVVNLGTNDAICAGAHELGRTYYCDDDGWVDFSVSDIVPDMEDFYGTLPDDACVVAVTVRTGDEVNETLIEWHEGSRISGVADWDGYVDSWGGEPLVEDFAGHPTAAGQRELGAFLAEEVERIC